MIVDKTKRTQLADFFAELNADHERKTGKFEQIIAYLEVIQAVTGKYSKNKPLIFADCCAGNCYLSFITYYFCKIMEQRDVTIYCIDSNETLMNQNREIAEKHGFKKMFFKAVDIDDFNIDGSIDLVYSLHACNDATDKTIWLGIRKNAASILSVSCCQHSLINSICSENLAGITRNKIFRDRLAYMTGDSMRALILETKGYKTVIREFVSAKYTDKNTMIRATKGNDVNRLKARKQYETLSEMFNLSVELEKYLTAEK